MFLERFPYVLREKSWEQDKKKNVSGVLPLEQISKEFWNQHFPTLTWFQILTTEDFL